MLKFESIKRDLSAENNGEWRPVREWRDPATGEVFKLKCRSLEYAPYQKAREQELLRLSKEYEPLPVPDDVWHKALGVLLAAHILLEWSGCDLAYDANTAGAILCDPEWKVLRRKVIDIANEVGSRDLQFVKAAEKNFEAPSATS